MSASKEQKADHIAKQRKAHMLNVRALIDVLKHEISEFEAQSSDLRKKDRLSFRDTKLRTENVEKQLLVSTPNFRELQSAVSDLKKAHATCYDELSRDIDNYSPVVSLWDNVISEYHAVASYNETVLATGWNVSLLYIATIVFGLGSGVAGAMLIESTLSSTAAPADGAPAVRGAEYVIQILAGIGGGLFAIFGGSQIAPYIGKELLSGHSETSSKIAMILGVAVSISAAVYTFKIGF